MTLTPSRLRLNPKCLNARLPSLWIFLLLLLPLLAGPVAPAARAQAVKVNYTDSGEEFNGPFASWKNVKDYGAVGDGVHDDAPAIQAALTDFQYLTAKSYCVLYFPAGTYRLKKTLTISRGGDGNHGYIHFRIVGSDPATTILKWGGAAGGNLLNLDA